MHPEIGQTYELSTHTCRLCLGSKEELEPLHAALTENEMANVIGGLFKIDLEENWPFHSACIKCIKEVRVIESIRSEIYEKNRIFDVLWTQYKRIHLEADSINKGKNSASKDNVNNLPAEYVIEELVVEKPEVDMLQPDMLLKEANTQPDIIIKLEEHDEEELMCEELTLNESDLDIDEIIEEEKDEMNDTNDGSMIEALMAEQDDTLQDVAESESEHRNDNLYEVVNDEEGSLDGESYFDGTNMRCFICMESPDSENTLEEHLNVAHQDLLPYHCNKCLLQFNSLHDVNQHLITHVFPFVCLYCPMKYCNEELLSKHNKVCCSYRCALCPAEFALKTHLNAHKRQHTAERRNKHKCSDCGRTFPQAIKLRRHTQLGCTAAKDVQMRKNVRKRTLEPKASSGATKRSTSQMALNLLMCQVCNRKFDNNSFLARHIERDHSEFRLTLFPCNICSKKFTSFEKSLRHQAYHRRATVKPIETKKTKESDTVCKICNKMFRVDHQLLRHLTEDHSLTLELFECDQCTRKFSTEFKLRKHQYNSHRENKPLFVCSHCGQKFEKKLTLKDHETKHLGMPAYKCDVCDKTFIHKHSLDRHALVHSDEKHFACDFCGKTFKRNTTLVVHRRIHTGEKPYQCEPCGLRFIDSSTLIKHRQRAHMKVE
ncbi:zinc finger protein 883-like [Anopheles moucheti]|uniref:zinc finger protein 883-like n=1 Tax=Anopheles moucheti TaxID=186751 RepID=UPI0022F0DB15|nr:zinc finger protein 883-like [Anopheles moucheti]